MLIGIFEALLLTSVIGTAMAAVLMISCRMTKKHCSAGWHYYMWLLVLVVMVLPIKISLPEGMRLIKQQEASAWAFEYAYADEYAHNVIWQYVEAEVPVSGAESGYHVGSTIAAFIELMEGNLNIISSAWIVVAVVLFAVKVVGYVHFRLKLMKNSEELICPIIKKFTRRNIVVKKSLLIHSPIMVGVLKPMLVLPDVELTDEQLGNVLAHEITHFKRYDIAAKWFVTLVKCIHWYNPMVYAVARQADLWCEISCDITAVKQMDNEGKRSYIDTILALISTGGSKSISLTTGMLGSKEVLKRRFLMIKNKSVISKKAKIVSGVLAAALLVGTLGVSGVLANDVLDGETTEVAEGSYTEAAKENVVAATESDVVYEARNAEEVLVGIVMNNEAGDVSGEVRYIYTDDNTTSEVVDATKTDNVEISWPLSSSEKITAAFATRVHPVTGKTFAHNGIDIGVKTGTEVMAAISGKVTLAGWDGGYGYSVVISDGDIEIRYAHLSEMLVEKGDIVTAGQLVAKSGNTGNSTGPHLHFELKIDGENVDPSLYVK